MHRRIGAVLWGVIFIACGLMGLLNIFFHWQFTFFPGWWTLFIIVPAVVNIITNGIQFGNIILLLIGGGFLVEALDLFPNINVYAAMFALAAILIGIKIIIGKGSGHPVKGIFVSDRTKADDILEYLAVFGGIEVKNTSTDLQGGSVTAVFGGGDIDLTDAVVNYDISIDATAIFGGVTIYAPKNAKVVVTGIPIFGGYSNKTRDNADPDAKVVKINCVSIFGGVEIEAPRY